jgi:hypothetical protein
LPSIRSQFMENYSCVVAHGGMVWTVSREVMKRPGPYLRSRDTGGDARTGSAIKSAQISCEARAPNEGKVKEW